MTTSKDVLERAYDLVSTPPYPWNEHGECCIYCAIATAKTELDLLYGDSLSFEDLLLYGMTGQISFKESDTPLREARDIIQLAEDKLEDEGILDYGELHYGDR